MEMYYSTYVRGYVPNMSSPLKRALSSRLEMRKLLKMVFGSQVASVGVVSFH
jgi:hypothetical protein